MKSTMAFLALVYSATVFAQSGGGLPRVGSSLPDVAGYDIEGREFPLSKLRGEYSVVVFGCLT